MDTSAFGWLELILGAIGLALGVMGKSNRATVVISFGLVVMGLSHLVAKNYKAPVGDVGGLILLFGLGMMVAFSRKKRPKKGPEGQ